MSCRQGGDKTTTNVLPTRGRYNYYLCIADKGETQLLLLSWMRQCTMLIPNNNPVSLHLQYSFISNDTIFLAHTLKICTFSILQCNCNLLYSVFVSSVNKMNCELMLTYDTPALWQTGSRNLTGQKTLPTIWGTYEACDQISDFCHQ